MQDVIKRAVRSALAARGLELTRTDANRLIAEADQPTRHIIEQVAPYTMTPPGRVLALIRAIRYLTANAIPGAVVECGVWRGGSSMAAALTLIDGNDTDRDIYLFDTFEGMPPPTEHDVKWDGRRAVDLYEEGWCAADMDDVRHNMVSTGYPAGRLHLICGLVQDTIPDKAPANIALARLDTDFYESSRHELEHLLERIAPGGVVIFDDYGGWQGQRKAVDEFFAGRGEHPLLHRIDASAAMLVAR